MNEEYEVIADASPLAQGDVFEWTREHSVRPFQQLGVVVTADCDLEHGKTEGRLSYVPALTAEDYIWYFWRKKRLAQELRQAIGTLAVRTTKILARHNPQQRPISSEAMEFMLGQHGAKLPDTLGLTDPGEVANYRRPLDAALRYVEMCGDEAPNIDKLIATYSQVIAKSKKETATRLSKEFQASIGSLPGDVFHITTHQGREDGGLFLTLRRITQCELADITYKPDELRFGRAKARRIGRIAAPFRYAMTQALGRIFSDIGLPTEYEARRAKSSQNFFQSREAP